MWRKRLVRATRAVRLQPPVAAAAGDMAVLLRNEVEKAQAAITSSAAVAATAGSKACNFLFSLWWNGQLGLEVLLTVVNVAVLQRTNTLY